MHEILQNANSITWETTEYTNMIELRHSAICGFGKVLHPYNARINGSIYRNDYIEMLFRYIYTIYTNV